MQDSTQIIIAGSGPAGTATALGLQQMGYQVTVVTSPRVFAACEGISERVFQGLRNAGIRHGLDTVAEASQRQAHWNGISSVANTERLVRRDLFDEALLTDLEDAGIRVIRGRVSHTKTDNDVIHVSVADAGGEAFSLPATFFVDARGRSAPGGKQARMRGPETVSLLQQWQGEPQAPQSAATSFADGWAWMARFSDGRSYTQLTLAADDIPPRAQLADFFFPRLHQIMDARPFYQEAVKVGELHARSATAILHCDPIDERVMRVGDAALAVDPLSGNGIFQALSTGLLAPRVINTLLNREESADMARQFYRERVNHAFMRFARLGRDFYRQESRWSEQPFWSERQIWPDQNPVHEPAAPAQLTLKRRPVVSGDFISEAEVVVTPDQPLGIWHLQGIELAPLVRRLQNRDTQAHPLQTTAQIQGFLQEALRETGTDAGPQQLQALSGWLCEQQLIEQP